MRHRICTLCLVICAFSAASLASAQELLATPGGQLTAVGDIVEVEIRHRRSNHVWLGGFFSVEYGDGLELADFQYTDATDPMYSAEPFKEPGLLRRAGVGDFNGVDNDAVIMRLWFRVLRDGIHEVSPSATGLAGAEWASAIDFGTFVVPVYRKAFIATPSADERDFATFENLQVARDRFALTLVVRTTLPIVSSGSAPVTLDNLEVAYGGADDFFVASENCTGAPLTPGQLCEVEIEFLNRDPIGGPVRRASLAIGSDASTFPERKVRLRTDVFVRDMRLSQVAFADVPIGTNGRTYSMFLLNAGATETTIDEFRLSQQFGFVTFTIVQDDCTGVSLPAGAVCNFDLHIVAAPGFDSTENTSLLITRDGNEYPEYIFLRALPPAARAP